LLDGAKAGNPARLAANPHRDSLREPGGEMSDQKKRVAVGFEELAYSNMMTLNALVELLEEKGVVTKKEVLDRVKRLQEATWKPD
jgi:hypothetical protein